MATRKTILAIIADLKSTLFAGYNLPDIPVRTIRNNSCWAYYWDSKDALYFHRELLDHPQARDIIAHELVHQWQAVYNTDCDSDHELNGSHDRYFWGWSHDFVKHGLDLQETY